MVDVSLLVGLDRRFLRMIPARNRSSSDPNWRSMCAIGADGGRPSSTALLNGLNGRLGVRPPTWAGA